MSKWNHDRIILALVQRGEKVANLANEHVYIHLYPQKVNVAYIWSISSLKQNEEGAIWLRESHKIFDKSKISGKDQFLENVGAWKDWMKYKVLDWDAFAKKLGLSLGEEDEEKVEMEESNEAINKDSIEIVFEIYKEEGNDLRLEFSGQFSDLKLKNDNANISSKLYSELLNNEIVLQYCTGYLKDHESDSVLNYSWDATVSDVMEESEEHFIRLKKINDEKLSFLYVDPMDDDEFESVDHELINRFFNESFDNAEDLDSRLIDFRTDNMCSLQYLIENF